MKILVADDHELIREGLGRALASLADDTEIVQAKDRATVLEQLERHNNIDIILIDLFMPGAKGFDLLITVSNTYSHIPVIVISGSEEPRNMRKSIDNGASGFIPKSATTEIMLSAIKLVYSGGVYIPPGMLIPIQNKRKEENGTNVSLIDETRDAAYKLTKRQKEVLDLMARGMSNKEIARALDISEHTVKIHVTAILKLLNAENRTEAVVMAHNAGIIDT